MKAGRRVEVMLPVGGGRRAQLGRVSLFWRPAKETEHPVFPVAGGSVTSSGGFGMGAASLGWFGRGGDGECRMDLGYGGPDGGAVLAVSVAEVFGCLRCELFGAAEMFWSGHRCSSCLARYWSDTAHVRPANWLKARSMDTLTPASVWSELQKLREQDPSCAGSDVDDGLSSRW